MRCLKIPMTDVIFELSTFTGFMLSAFHQLLRQIHARVCLGMARERNHNNEFYLHFEFTKSRVQYYIYGILLAAHR